MTSEEQRETVHRSKPGYGEALRAGLGLTPAKGSVFTVCGLTWPPKYWGRGHGWVAAPGEWSGDPALRCPGCFPPPGAPEVFGEEDC